MKPPLLRNPQDGRCKITNTTASQRPKEPASLGQRADRLRDLSLVITDDWLRCDWLGRIGVIVTRAVRHLAAYPFGSDRWLHRPRCLVGK